MRIKLGAKHLVEIGAAKCPPGEILRKGYKRKGYTRADGVRVKGARVSAGCVEDRGAPGKTPPEKRWAREIPGLRGKKVELRGTVPMLGKKEFIPGWEAKDTAGGRRAAVKKNVAREGCLTVSRKLVVVHNLNFRQNPSVAQKAMADRDWAVEQDWCRLKKKER